VSIPSVFPRFVAWILAIASLATVLCCTPSDPSPLGSKPRLALGLMYWAQPRYILGDNHALVFAATVEHTTTRPAEHPEIRGDTIYEARLRVERVLHQHTPPDADPARPPPRLRPGDLATTDGADGVQAGDRLLVFATAYEGGYAIVPRLGTTTSLGIVVDDWSDPIVEATTRWLDGRADLRNEAEAAAWRPYGDVAIDCVLAGVPVCGTL
jgi:hypothetical protein